MTLDYPAGPIGGGPVADRTRTYNWPAPATASARTTRYSGLEALQQVLDGQLPISPGAHTLGIELTDFSRGEVRMTARPGEWACNSGGTVHGGIVSGWVDSALGYATASAVDAGVGYSTLDLTVRYLRALRLDATPAILVATVEHCGRSTAVVQVTVRDTEGHACATASGAMMLFRPAS